MIQQLPVSAQGSLEGFVRGCLLQLREQNVSDIEFGGEGCGGSIWMRLYGVKKPVPEYGAFSLDEFALLILSLLTKEQRETLIANRNLDFAYTIDDGGQILRHRADAYFERDALAMNVRPVQATLRNWDGYHFPIGVTKMLSLAHSKEGLILITGITGSGKSNTLDAIVNLNNESVPGHIVIIASPIEYIHPSKKCLVRHREVGRDTLTFHSGIVEALRQDPDIIVIGEMRDSETIIATLEAADSGHKVLSTLHTSSAMESIDRLIGETPPVEQERVRMRVADVLRCVVSQKLVPGIGGERVLAKEIMLLTPSIRAAIKNNNTIEIYQMMTEGSALGMITMERDLAQLYFSKRITRDTAMDFANNKRMMQQLLRGIP